MSSSTPNKPEDPALAPDKVLTELNVQETLAFRRRTPDSVQVTLSADEQRTIDYLRDKDQGFWKRVGKYEKLLKEQASAEAPELLRRMQGLSGSTTERLRFLGRKNAERLAQITAKINVAGRTLDAIRKQREIFAQTSKDLAEGNASFRAQVMADHPITSRIPLVRRFLLPRETSLKEVHDLDYTKLEQAARNIQFKEKSKKSQWEAQINQRLRGVRGVENKLREVILRYDKDAIDDVEAELRACAGKECGLLRRRVENLTTTGLDDRSRKVLQDNLEMWIKMLEGRSGGMSKAFEIAGRTELLGTTPEVLTQISSMAIGTRLRVTIPGFAPETRDVILDAKRPANCLLFKTVGSQQRIAMDPKQRVAWGYEADVSPALQRLNAFIGEIKPALAAEKIVDTALNAKVVNAVIDAVGDDPIEIDGERLAKLVETTLTGANVEAAKAQKVREALEGKIRALPAFPAFLSEIKTTLNIYGVTDATVLAEVEAKVRADTSMDKNTLIIAIEAILTTASVDPAKVDPTKLALIKTDLEKITAFGNLSNIVKHKDIKPFARQIEFDHIRFKYPNN